METLLIDLGVVCAIVTVIIGASWLIDKLTGGPPYGTTG